MRRRLLAVGVVRTGASAAGAVPARRGDGGSQSHTEVGPSVDAVPHAAHVCSGVDTWVAGVGAR
jgi:hypothetical protein